MNKGALYLFKKRTFFPLFLTQFFGAFNDNAFKLAMLTLLSYHLSQSQAQSEHYQALAGGLFMLPFFLFSAMAGQLADKFDKARLVRIIKSVEILLMIMGGFGLYYGNLLLMMITLTGMGIHSTFFGPIKYAILPDHLPRSELLAATALIEASTFIAILLGTTLGSLSISGIRLGALYAIVLTSTAAFAGLISSCFIPKAPSTAIALPIDWHIWRATNRMLRQVISNARIVPAIFAISWFWLIGGVVLTKLPDYTHFVLHADTTVFALFLALFSVGIALGSMAINRLLVGQITLQYVPHAMLLLSVFIFDLYWITPSQVSDLPLWSLPQFFSSLLHWRIAGDLFFFAFCGGLFVVPLYTYLQIVSADIARARTIAANNIFNAVFMVIGTLLVMVLLHFHVSISIVFLGLAILNTIAVIIFWILRSRIQS